MLQKERNLSLSRERLPPVVSQGEWKHSQANQQRKKNITLSGGVGKKIYKNIARSFQGEHGWFGGDSH